MKLTITGIGVLAAIVVLTSVGGIYAFQMYSDSPIFAQGNSLPPGASMMLGNVKVTHFDENGEVIGYRQGDNHITKWGMAIIMGQIFVDVNGSGTYQTSGNVTGRVGYMQIGTGGEQTVYANKLAWNNTDISEPIGDRSVAGFCGRVRAAIDNATQGPAHGSPSSCINLDLGKGNCFAQHNVTAVAQFDGANCEIASIDEAGIYNNPGEQSGLMFARNTFGEVTLGSMDTLQLEWEFTFRDS